MDSGTLFLINLIVIFSIVGQYANSLQYGECSQKRESLEAVSLNESLPSSSCSRSSSCVAFDDCCYGSSFRRHNFNYWKQRGDRVAKVPIVCLRVDNLGLFSAINGCPSTWRHSEEYCRGGIGHLPPVTSLSTGATYTNIFCAECNGDSSNVTHWDVQLRCCAAGSHELLHVESSRKSKVGFYFLGNELWRWATNGKVRAQCQCKFQPRSSKPFVPKLAELRFCPNSLKTTSTCSPYWKGERTKQSCLSYLDPVYVHDRVFRNLHCATCNYDDISQATCVPDIVMALSGYKSLNEIRKICEDHQFKSCLHYLMNPKGERSAFSDIFPVNMKECLPNRKSGRRCCEGEQYDFRYKRCRKISSQRKSG